MPPVRLYNRGGVRCALPRPLPSISRNGKISNGGPSRVLFQRGRRAKIVLFSAEGKTDLQIAATLNVLAAWRAATGDELRGLGATPGEWTVKSGVERGAPVHDPVPNTALIAEGRRVTTLP